MALKYKIAFGLAVVTGLLTVFLSFLYGVRAITILYRGAFTSVLFFALGYIIGIVVESNIKTILESDSHKGKKIDISDEPDSKILLKSDAPDTAGAENKFKPLNPDDFMSIRPTQK